MNPSLPEWNIEAEVPLANQKKTMGLDHDLVELLWRNGQVVLHSQTQKKSILDPNDSIQIPKHHENQSSLIQYDETSSWLNNCPVYDSFEKEFCAPFLSEIPTFHYHDQPENDNNKISSNPNPMPPPPAAIRECSVMTVGSSHCGSNQVSNNRGLSTAVNKNRAENRVSPWTETGEEETAGTSSSGQSGSSFARTCNRSAGKRKVRDGEESECQREGAEFESGDNTNKSTNKSGSTTRRSRAAEVHNLSERRRRDRINEKMRALQELLPHSNKTDKASMLDDAIEYLKSLQMQLQMMWMGSGMATMMFPGMQHYMSRMGMGMVPTTTLPSIHPTMHLPNSVPSAQNQPQILNPMNYSNQMQNPNFAEQFAAYMGFHPMQNPSQPLNMFSLGSHSPQPNPMFNPPNNGNGPSA